jgi:hypothetical protein
MAVYMASNSSRRAAMPDQPEHSVGAELEFFLLPVRLTTLLSSSEIQSFFAPQLAPAAPFL